MLRAQSRYDLGSLLCLSLVGLELDVLTKLGAGSGERAISIDPPQNFEPIDAERVSCVNLIGGNELFDQSTLLDPA
ncbi:hypothetical protein EDD17DRAFT_1601708 [Pisolithus thermaeus]|nr:hypothetical protein EDD17DRAFT_1601708 [Pisolithus thermaeus]